MTRHVSMDAFLYVDDRCQPIEVKMYTDEHSDVCSIRFSNSFTLNVVTPQDLLMLAQELETFAKRAYELHYREEPTVVKRPVGEVMTELQQKLEDCGLFNKEEEELAESDDFYSALIDQNIAAASKTPTPDSPSKVDLLMQGTVSAPQIDPMNDPMNW